MTALGFTLALAPAVPDPALSRLVIPLVRLEPSPAPEEVLAPWCKLVEDSPEPCLVLDQTGVVVSASGMAADLLGEYGPDQVVGHHLLDVLDLVDFHGGVAGAVYADRIAPLLALSGDTLARGLIRVRLADGATRTLDVVAAPLHEPSGKVAGTVAFLSTNWS
jgi:PAS domain S-box-containing protein